MLNNNKNIVLIGLMGAGKTSVGKELSIITGFTFIDIDNIIEEREGTKISEIFASKGEKHFRQLEIDTIKEFSQHSKQVISTGGGAPEKVTNISNLKSNGTLYYLYAPVDVLYERLSSEMSNRPMLFEDNPKDKLLFLLNRREPFYLSADYTVNTTNKTILDIVQEVITLHNGDNNEH